MPYALYQNTESQGDAPYSKEELNVAMKVWSQYAKDENISYKQIEGLPRIELELSLSQLEEILEKKHELGLNYDRYMVIKYKREH